MTGFGSRCNAIFLATLVVILAASRPEAEAQDAASVVVLFNKNDPDSQSLARYYAKKRNVPMAQVVGLDCPTGEEIQRVDYETKIAGPLRTLFRARSWWKVAEGPHPVVSATKIRFLAIIRGMPLKIAQDMTIVPMAPNPAIPIVVAATNAASLDSELTVLGLFPDSPAGVVQNPYFARYTDIRDNPVPPGMLLPSRLDGPTPEIVRRMIDDAVATEKAGLTGWSYVDGRGITTGGYAEGDKWMGNLVVAMRGAGLPVIFDNEEPTFPVGYPLNDAAVYYGWYAGGVCGPFLDPAFRFRKGAVAVHIHSFSAHTLLDASSGWCGPLVARGAAATLGNVYEPYLTLTANLDVFQDRLMAGFTLAESAWISQRVLSWMGIAVGDPLYRPYASWKSPGKPPKPGSWEAYRAIVLGTRGGVLAAAEALQRQARETGRSAFLEALGAAQQDAKDYEAALKNFREALQMTSDLDVRVRLNLEILACMVALGKADKAEVLARAVIDAMPEGPARGIFGKFLPPPPPAPPEPQASPVP